MSPNPRPFSLADAARVGFQELTASRDALAELLPDLSVGAGELLQAFTLAADPDAALARIRELCERYPALLEGLDASSLGRLCLLVGASPALGDFFTRHPEGLVDLLSGGGALVPAAQAREALQTAVHHPETGETLAGDAGWTALRVAYRQLLASVALFDMERTTEGLAEEAFEHVAGSLSVLAAAAVEASLTVARATLAAGLSGPAVRQGRLDAVRLAIVAMGKCGAEELNVVSDVDVVFIAESADDDALDTDALIRIATRASPPRQCADPRPKGLSLRCGSLTRISRPEGRHGALVPDPRLDARLLRQVGEGLGVSGTPEGASAGGRSGTWCRVCRRHSGTCLGILLA